MTEKLFLLNLRILSATFGHYPSFQLQTRRGLPLMLVGTLKDGYVRNVPLPQIPQIQRASPELIAPNKTETPLPGILPVSSWIPMLPKMGNISGCSQRLL
jgi:hypothetical protein